jgi:hypothetical protein
MARVVQEGLERKNALRMRAWAARNNEILSNVEGSQLCLTFKALASTKLLGGEQMGILKHMVLGQMLRAFTE